MKEKIHDFKQTLAFILNKIYILLRIKKVKNILSKNKYDNTELIESYLTIFYGLVKLHRITEERKLNDYLNYKVHLHFYSFGLRIWSTTYRCEDKPELFKL